MDAAMAGGDDRRARGGAAPAVGRHGAETGVSGAPDVALPLPPSTDRTPGVPRTDRCGATPDELVPPEPVHRRAPRRRT